MELKERLFENYRDKIIDFDYIDNESLQRFLIERQDDVSIYYSTHNEYINAKAEYLFVGICPGRQQMIKSLNTARDMLLAGEDETSILKQCKIESRLYGSTRSNLIDMLQAIGFKDASDLFDNVNDKLHTTSLVRYPIFIGDELKNYNGHSPKLDKNELINKFALDFKYELSHLHDLKIIIPLGKAVEEYLLKIYENNKSVKDKILKGLPHPSGANGHRKKMFERNRNLLSQEIVRILK